MAEKILTPEMIDRIKATYLENPDARQSDVAVMLGISHVSVRRALKRAGVPGKKQVRMFQPEKSMGVELKKWGWL